MPGRQQLLICDVMTAHASIRAFIQIFQFHQTKLQRFDVAGAIDAQFDIALGMGIFVSTARAVATFTTHPVFSVAPFLAGDDRAVTGHALICAFEHTRRIDARQPGDFFISRGIVEERIDRYFVRIVFPPVVFLSVAIALAQAATARP